MRLLVFLSCVLASPAMADVFMFETPSGNIQCSVGLDITATDINCEIVEKSGPPALPRPSNCNASWGHTFTMVETGPVTMECSPRPRDFTIAEKAPYGVSGSWGDITCMSETTGLTCRNADGRGFFLSRRSQKVF